MSLRLDGNRFVEDYECKNCGNLVGIKGDCPECGENDWKRAEVFNLSVGDKMKHKELGRVVKVLEVVDSHDKARQYHPEGESKKGYLVKIPSENAKGYVTYERVTEFEVA